MANSTLVFELSKPSRLRRFTAHPRSRWSSSSLSLFWLWPARSPRVITSGLPAREGSTPRAMNLVVCSSRSRKSSRPRAFLRANAVKIVSKLSCQKTLLGVTNRLAHEALRLSFHDAIGFSKSLGPAAGTGADGSIMLFNTTELKDRKQPIRFRGLPIGSNV